jgi:hypothetical protein
MVVARESGLALGGAISRLLKPSDREAYLDYPAKCFSISG